MKRLLLAAAIALALFPMLLAGTANDTRGAEPPPPTAATAPAAGAGRSGQSWDFANDFSDTKNPSGAWTYGYKRGTDGNFTAYTVIRPSEHLAEQVPMWHLPAASQIPCVWKNSANGALTFVEPGHAALHPGRDGEISIVRWTAPAGGSYDFRVKFSPGDSAITEVFVWRGDKLLYRELSRNDPLEFKQEGIFLAAGEALDFAVGPSGNIHGGTTPTDISIVLRSCLPPGPSVARRSDADRVVLAGGSAIAGRIEAEKFSIATSFGKFDFPAAQVIGMVRAPAGRRPAQLLLVDGQVLVGDLAGGIIVRPANGESRTVDANSLQELAYQVSDAKPLYREAAGFLVGLRDGTRLLCDGGPEKLELEALGRKLTLPGGSLMGASLMDGNGPEGGLHRVYLTSGSSITGRLVAEKLLVVPKLAPKMEVARANLALLSWPRPMATIADAAIIELPGGDRLCGRLLGELTITTPEGSSAHKFVNLRSIKPLPDGRLAVQLWDGRNITGTVADGGDANKGPLPFDMGGGLVLALGPRDLGSVRLPEPQPPEEWSKLVEERIRQLGSDKWSVREEATRALSAMPKNIMPILRKHENDEDPEIRARIAQILKTLQGNAPSTTPPGRPE